jgi:5-methylcytosine-specific restriction protein A
MPTLNLPPKKVKEYKRTTHSTKRDNVIHKAVYNTSDWKKLRLEYLIAHPLCENCIQNGIIESAIDVHHKVPISQGVDLLEKRTIGLDWNNLKSVCKECHKKEHK